jgi:hypothetical protein
MAVYDIALIKPKTIERFWSRVDKSGIGDCWEWKGSKDTSGYGLIKVRSKHSKAHRISLVLHGFPAVDGMHALHSCDNPGCVNPSHLRWGTRRDNMRDRSERGRANLPRGQNHHMTTLTDDNVREIRMSHLSGVDLARKFGVTRATICDIRKRRVWNHIA